jgi:hypothetical protein
MSVLGRIGAYAANLDPRAAACNMIALVVAWNQPLYPLYVLWLVGGDAWAACWTFLSTPFFVAVPWLARRNALAGRLLLPLTGIANGMLSAKAFGVASGVELFLLPCLLIAILALRPAEWRWAAGLILLSGAVLSLHAHYGAPLGHFSATDYPRFFHLNAWSVATLCVFILWRLGDAIRSEGRTSSLPSTPPSPRTP